LSIQIIQYEFLGPIPLDEWGPPMEKLVYLIMSRNDDRFNIVYVGDCENTDDKSFFIHNLNFKCWVKQSGSEKSLYVAILPLFESSTSYRQNVINKIKIRYKPICNSDENSEVKLDYVVRKKELPLNKKPFFCSNCGFEIKSEPISGNSTIVHCSNCDTETKINY
jgi:hypothetical protein